MRDHREPPVTASAVHPRAVWQCIEFVQKDDARPHRPRLFEDRVDRLDDGVEVPGTVREPLRHAGRDQGHSKRSREGTHQGRFPSAGRPAKDDPGGLRERPSAGSPRIEFRDEVGAPRHSRAVAVKVLQKRRRVDCGVDDASGCRSGDEAFDTSCGGTPMPDRGHEVGQVQACGDACGDAGRGAAVEHRRDDAGDGDVIGAGQGDGHVCRRDEGG